MVGVPDDRIELTNRKAFKYKNLDYYVENNKSLADFNCDLKKDEYFILGDDQNNGYNFVYLPPIKK